MFQSVSMAYDEVTEDAVYACVGQPSRKDISMIVEWMLNREFADAFRCKKTNCSILIITVFIIIKYFYCWKFENDCKVFSFFSVISEMKIRKGYALQDIITDVHSYVHRRNKNGFLIWSQVIGGKNRKNLEKLWRGVKNIQ